MRRASGYLRIVSVGALFIAVSACSSGPAPNVTAGSTSVATVGEIETIALLLDNGQVRDAQNRLEIALRRDPTNPSLLVLRQGIVGNAKEDLGLASYSYTVAEGDTIAQIARDHLGNRLKSFQLARYNGIDNPSTLTPGQVLRIPGEAQRENSSSRGARSRPVSPNSNATAAASPARLVTPSAEAVTSPPRPSRPQSDPAGALRARTAGLAALNRGEISDAVSLLGRAAALDPANRTIANDLARARRIAATVRSQR